MPYEVANKTDKLAHVRRLIQSGQLDELVDRFATRPLVIRTPDGVFKVEPGAPAGPGEISTLPAERFDG